MAPPAIRVDRARLVHARPGDRGRLESAFDLASPAATGVAERALLLIPRMRVERPLADGVEGFANELIDRIRAAKVDARRGSAGAASGLYFEDEVAAEVEIVRAWLAGDRLPEALRRTIPSSDAPVSRWRRYLFADHRNLPRVISALVEAHLAGPWIARFSDGELVAAAGQLARFYGAAMPLSPESVQRASHPSPWSRAAPNGSVSQPSAIVEAVRIARTLAPQPGARIFLAVAWLAARQPALVATQAFRAALASLSPVGNPSSARTVEPPARRSCRRTMGLPGAKASPVPAPVTVPPMPKTRGVGSEPLAVPPSRRPDRSAGAIPHTADPVRSPPVRLSHGTVDAMAAPSPGEAMAVASDHAGLFFLLNTFLALGLYGDFTDPVRRVHGLSPFELLLLLGRYWRGRSFEADPVAPLLRSLAGLGRRERPGRHFEAPAWQVPADWLAPWPPRRPRTVRGHFGLSRWHAAGFPVEDRRPVPHSATWLRRRWVACLARYIEARLMRALNLDDKIEAVAMVIARRGTVHVDPERVEVEFPLDTHPLAIRLAGLDRDPGWIPAAGRSFRFQFA